MAENESEPQNISIHALLAESDRMPARQRQTLRYFYPRSPCGERRNARPETRRLCAISIHALLAESDVRRATGTAGSLAISIHALLAESDTLVTTHVTISTCDFYPRSPCGERHFDHLQICLQAGISIHALLAESDLEQSASYNAYLEFLSTLSLRRATRLPTALRTPHHNFYPRSPCGERQGADFGHKMISNFYPRSPCGERLNDAINGCNPDFISIHALLAESDGGFGAGSWPRGIFLSTLSLRRATNRYGRPIDVQFVFLSTLSLRRATALGLLGWLRVLISIHALLAESDVSVLCFCGGAFDFYPRSPCGERRQVNQNSRAEISISIHALLAESDANCQHRSHQLCSDFYPRSPCGERP